MTQPHPYEALTLSEIAVKLHEEYGDALRVLATERGEKVVQATIRTIWDHQFYDPEDVHEIIQEARNGDVVPDSENSAENLHLFLYDVLEKLKAHEGPLTLSPASMAALLSAFEDAEESLKEHFGGPVGRPIPALSSLPCNNEVVMGKLAAAILMEEELEDRDLVVQEDGGAAVVVLHARGEHIEMSREFASLPEMVTGLRDMADEIKELVE